MIEKVKAVQERLQEWLGELNFSATQKKSLLAIFAVVVLASVLVVSRGGAAPIEAPVPVVNTPVLLTVDVAGGVKRPGVYSLTADSRVVDAIAAAGGANLGTDLSDINMARVMKDGEQIYVEPAPSIANTAHGVVKRVAKRSGPMNINRATAKELDALPGIGPVIAARIISYRKTNGPFSTLEDLLKVSGIGPSKFAQFKSKVRV